jgi:hypothetical protein
LRPILKTNIRAKLNYIWLNTKETIFQYIDESIILSNHRTIYHDSSNHRMMVEYKLRQEFLVHEMVRKSIGGYVET